MSVSKSVSKSVFKYNVQLYAAIAIALWISFALRSYHSHPQEILLHQSSIAAITPDYLRNLKQPVVIDEILANPMNLVDSLFRYSFVYKSVPKISAATTTKTRASFNLVFCKETTKETTKDVTIGVSTLADQEFITIKMKPGRTVIVPSRMKLRLDDSVKVVEMFDPISAFCSLFS